MTNFEGSNARPGSDQTRNDSGMGASDRPSRGKMKSKFNTRAAAYAAGVCSLLEIVPCITILLDRLVRGEEEQGIEISKEFRIIVYVSFGMYSLLALASMAFILGVKMDEKLLYIPWMTVLMALIVFEAVAVMIHKRQKRYEVLRNWDTIYMISFIIRVIVNVISLLVGMYHMKEVTNGRGTVQDIERRRQLRAERLRQRNLSTVTNGRMSGVPSLPTLVITKPPPYVDKPPSYCENNSPPPSYSSQPNISLALNLLRTLDGQDDLSPSAPPIIPPPDYSTCSEESDSASALPDDCFRDNYALQWTS